MNIWNRETPQHHKATVISGAQIGADIAGLRAAKACGLNTAGWIPAGGRTLDGALDQDTINFYGLIETEERNYLARTRKNVQTSDMTIRLAHNFDSPGEKATLRFIKEFNQPYYDVPLVFHERWKPLIYDQLVAHWIRSNHVTILNIAGNGDRAIEDCVEHFLTRVFTILGEDT